MTEVDTEPWAVDFVLPICCWSKEIWIGWSAPKPEPVSLTFAPGGPEFGFSVTLAGSSLPMALPVFSVNHTFPSVPLAIPTGPALDAGILNVDTEPLDGSSLPIAFPAV